MWLLGCLELDWLGDCWRRWVNEANSGSVVCFVDYLLDIGS